MSESTVDNTAIALAILLDNGGERSFLERAAEALAVGLGARGAGIACKLGDGRAEVVAMWDTGKLGENLIYNLHGTPCDEVIKGGDYCVYPERVAELFPEDAMLKDMGAFSFHGQVFRDGEGQDLGHVFALDDKATTPQPWQEELVGLIAGWVGTEIEKHRAEVALRESRETLRAVIDASPVMINAKDLDSRYVLMNRYQTEFYGVTQAEAVGKTAAELMGTAYVSDTRDLDQTVIESGEGLVNFEEELIDKTGARRNWLTTKVPLKDEAGRVHNVVTVSLDITERKRAEEELAALNETLEKRVEERTAELRASQADLLRQERMATLGQLTATVSHELRNPLGVIRTSIFIARDGLNGATPRVQRALERIDRSVIRCDRIIDELLDFTRISGLEPEPTPIDAWLDLTLKEQALPAEITLRRDFGLAGTTVPFDRDRFRRAIINVFDNACQAMTGEVGREAADADNAVLSVKTQRKNGRVEVIFEDRGPGIPADVLPRIFEPLFSTKGFGVGLGLPVVKRIMEQHGGGIEIDRAGTSGTRVCLWLPAERPTRPRT
ncbi:MAG: PAS domain-containing protein [Proteobacteria bacterium]|nr:PAS domain-containing protein [Pseudomonadota bacterium]